LDSILSDLEVPIQQKKAVVNIATLPLLKINPSQFRQLFQNLIINALKFSKENCCPEITIYAEKTTGLNIAGIDPILYNDDYCNIFIKDNGIGFEQKYADEIFTLFKRLNSIDKFEGTGIGLSI